LYCPVSEEPYLGCKEFTKIEVTYHFIYIYMHVCVCVCVCLCVHRYKYEKLITRKLAKYRHKYKIGTGVKCPQTLLLKKEWM